tara:strand:- start:1272 stop:1751 length:480 start_codon:yes stop_codon:yes gene_type:complete
MFKRIFIILIALFIFAQYIDVSHSAGGNGEDTYLDLYKEGKQLVKRAEKMEKKNKLERAKKLYGKAQEKLRDANKVERNNPDILNYLGFALRKTGKFEEAEKFYMKGLKIKPDHNGINEYLGELYIQTGRKNLAEERLAVLKNCKCKEYEELKEIIEKN